MKQEFPKLTDQALAALNAYKSALFNASPSYFEAERGGLAAFLRKALEEAEEEGSVYTNLYQNLIKIANNLHNSSIPVPTPKEALSLLSSLEDGLVLTTRNVEMLNKIRSTLKAVKPE